MAAGRVLLRVRSHSGPCLDLLQSGIVRTSARPLKGPAAVARPPGCVVAISFSRQSASGRKTAYLRSVRAAKDMDRGIDCWIYLCPFAAVGAQRLDMGAPGRGAYPGWQFGGLSTSTGVGLF